MKKYLIPNTGKFYKANLHCHTTVSDGSLTPSEIKEEYKKRGYSVIAYTDHNVLISQSHLNDDEFLALNGYEVDISQKYAGNNPYKKTCHICYVALDPDNLKQVCWHREKYLYSNSSKYKDQVQFDENEPDFERIYTAECINEMNKRAKDNGFFVTYNHPTWSLESYPDYMSYEYIDAMEICNYGCITEGYPDYNPRVYDDMLRGGKRVFCVATDDNHNRYPCDSVNSDSFGGYTMIKADSLDYRTIADALKNGHFYASQGAEIKELWYEDSKLHVECGPASRIEFVFGKRKAKLFLPEKGELLNSAEFEVPEDAYYVRVTVYDENGNPANSNAYFVDELNK